jgi:hypothetical protein
LIASASVWTSIEVSLRRERRLLHWTRIRNRWIYGRHVIVERNVGVIFTVSECGCSNSFERIIRH